MSTSSSESQWVPVPLSFPSQCKSKWPPSWFCPPMEGIPWRCREMQRETTRTSMDLQNEKSQDNDASWLSVFARNARALVFSDIFRPFEAVWVTNGTCCWALKPIEMVDMNCTSNVAGIHPDAINPSSGTGRPIFSCAETATAASTIEHSFPDLDLWCYAATLLGLPRLLPRSRGIWHCQGHILHNFMIFHY